VFLGLVALNLFKIKRPALYIILGLLLWYFIFNSGVHATIAGVLLAFTIPLRRIESLEEALHDVVHFIIMPLFALANTAIILPGDFSSVFTSPIHHGILTGLFLGKPIGIVSFCFLAVKLKLASLPAGMQWKQLIGTSIVAGIGFTMSIFIATLAFQEEEYQLIAKIAIIAASVLAGVVGFVYLRLIGVKKESVIA
jgi:NhaA family Na+:H+ antiporter